jgi:bifunctional N-acetylglucosamine-1-phosphate-uridyltransferase/glucosamine-1-phosphate-acetyltransferase GlmU-like protein
MLRPEDFFNLEGFEHRDLFEGLQLVWEVFARLKSYIKEALRPNVADLRKGGDLIPKTAVLYRGEVLYDGFEIEQGDAVKGNLKVYSQGRLLKGATVIYAGAFLSDDNIAIGEGTVVEPGSMIKGPAIIGRNTEVRQGAYIRGNCIIGDRCVVGHTTEMKGSVMLDDAKAGHFAYIGDSILGNNINLGAGTKLANLRLIDSEIILRIGDRSYQTGLRKFGAILGDNTETGCNSVTNPGTLIGRDSIVYPGITVGGGYYPPGSRISMKGRELNVKR